MTIDFAKRSAKQPTKNKETSLSANNQTTSLSQQGVMGGARPHPSLRFKNKDIFGDTFDAYWLKAQGHVMSLLLSGKVKKDGTVTGGELSELWSYIYLLYLNNKNYDVFDGMRGRRGPLMSKATAKRFIKVVKDHMKVREVGRDTLIDFINDVIKTRNPVNPLKDLLICKDFEKELRTSTQPQKDTSGLQERLAKSNAELQEYMVKVAVLESKIQSYEERLAKLIARPPSPVVAKSVEKPVVAASALARAGERERALQEKIRVMMENIKFLKKRLALLNAKYDQKSASVDQAKGLRLGEALAKMGQMRERLAALKEYPAQVIALEARLAKSNDFMAELVKETGVKKAQDVVPLVRVFKDRMRYLEDGLKQKKALLADVRKGLGAFSDDEVRQRIKDLKVAAKKPNVAWCAEHLPSR
jgi:CII-binding regulator of phage lambda lysogenization HflD